MVTTMRGSLLILSQHTKVLTPSLVRTDCSANTEKLSRLLWFFLRQRNSNTLKLQSQLYFHHCWWDKSWRQRLKWSLLEEGGKTLPRHPTYLDNILLRDTKNNEVGWKTAYREGQWNLLWKAESQLRITSRSKWTKDIFRTQNQSVTVKSEHTVCSKLWKGSSDGNSESEPEMLWYISGVQGEPRKVKCGKNEEFGQKNKCVCRQGDEAINEGLGLVSNNSVELTFWKIIMTVKRQEWVYWETINASQQEKTKRGSNPWRSKKSTDPTKPTGELSCGIWE